MLAKLISERLLCTTPMGGLIRVSLRYRLALGIAAALRRLVREHGGSKAEVEVGMQMLAEAMPQDEQGLSAKELGKTCRALVVSHAVSPSVPHADSLLLRECKHPHILKAAF
jgi:hypothetical protein